MNFPFFVNLIDLAEKMLQFSGIFEQPFGCFLDFLPGFFFITMQQQRAALFKAWLRFLMWIVISRFSSTY